MTAPQLRGTSLSDATLLNLYWVLHFSGSATTLEKEFCWKVGSIRDNKFIYTVLLVETSLFLLQGAGQEMGATRKKGSLVLPAWIP